MTNAEHAHLFQNALVKGLCLSSDARDAHELYIRYFVKAGFYEREVTADIEREAEGDEVGGEAGAGAEAASR